MLGLFYILFVCCEFLVVFKNRFVSVLQEKLFNNNDGFFNSKPFLLESEENLEEKEAPLEIHCEAVQRLTGRGVDGLPLERFEYDSILGQCCEMSVGYVQISVGIAGPLLLNGCEYSVSMATMEGCLVASTNRDYKAIQRRGGQGRDGVSERKVEEC